MGKVKSSLYIGCIRCHTTPDAGCATGKHGTGDDDSSPIACDGLEVSITSKETTWNTRYCSPEVQKSRASSWLLLAWPHGLQTLQATG